MKTATYKILALALGLGTLFPSQLLWAQPVTTNKVPTEDGGTSNSSGDPTKDEIAFWREKAKSYVTKPLSLKMQFESYRDQIQDLRRRNAELTVQISKMREPQGQQLPTGSVPPPTVADNTPKTTTPVAPPAPKKQEPKPDPVPAPRPIVNDVASASKLAELEAAFQREAKLNDSLRWTLVKIEGELEAERTKNKKLIVDLQSRKKSSDQGIKTGLVYRIQIGAYVINELSNSGVNTNDFIAERSDGYNKYIIGSCRTYAEAMHMRDDLRKLGIKDAWIVPYIDGERVTANEANEYTASQGVKSSQK